MKKVGLFLSSRPAQGGTFQYNLAVLEAVTALPRDRYAVTVAYTDPFWRKYLHPYPFVETVFTPLGIPGRIFALIWRELGLPVKFWRQIAPALLPAASMLTAQGCDLWIFPSQDCWSYQFDVPALVSVLDLMHRYERNFPEVSAWGRYRRLDCHYVNICRWARGVLTDSQVGRQQVTESYGIRADRVFELPYIPPRYLSHDNVSPDFMSRYALPDKFLFYPAQFWEHKNHVRLIQAVAQVRESFPDIRLVLVGTKKNAYEKVRRLMVDLGMDDCVRCLGYVPEGDMPEFYRRARALVMPTFFGPTNIPPLEAMAHGCPVAVSRIYAMPEQVGSAGLFFDPNSVEEIAAVISRLWDDDALCEELARRGKTRSEEWTQPHFNARLRETIDKLVHTSPA
jgi:glycosyltransferase involved in cell wall biosynthesis